MIEQFKVFTDDSLNTNTLVIAKKLSEVISEVNNMEAKLQSASPTNKDYTASIREILNGWNTAEDLHIDERCLRELAARLNAAIKKLHCV